MKKYSENYLAKIHRRSLENYNRVLKSQDCGCFYCLEHFLPLEAKFISDQNGLTAICPECGIDSVICSDTHVDDDLLVALNKRYFGYDEEVLIDTDVTEVIEIENLSDLVQVLKKDNKK